MPDGRAGVYSARTVSVAGGRVLVLALDLRYNKTPYAGRAGAGDFLGEAQWAWLEAEVGHADADAIVVVSSPPARKPFEPIRDTKVPTRAFPE